MEKKKRGRGRPISITPKIETARLYEGLRDIAKKLEQTPHAPKRLTNKFLDEEDRLDLAEAVDGQYLKDFWGEK